eukprot:5811153-Pyramimonas_sp.AAC.1
MVSPGPQLEDIELDPGGLLARGPEETAVERRGHPAMLPQELLERAPREEPGAAWNLKRPADTML